MVTFPVGLPLPPPLSKRQSALIRLKRGLRRCLRRLPVIASRVVFAPPLLCLKLVNIRGHIEAFPVPL